MAHLRDCSCLSCADLTTRSDKPFISSTTLANHCPLDGRSRSFKVPRIEPNSPGRHECGLQSLPVEIYHACLQHLDLATIISLRAVSQYTRECISSLHQYQELYEHAPQALRAVLATGIAASIPLLRLHHALTTRECYYCLTS